MKVMLDDFAQKEYELCRVFSQAQLGPAPLSLNGPCSVPGGDLYCIRMEPISHTLHGLLCVPWILIAPHSQKKPHHHHHHHQHHHHHHHHHHQQQQQQQRQQQESRLPLRSSKVASTVELPWFEAKTSRGLRHGLSPPQEMNAQRSCKES